MAGQSAYWHGRPPAEVRAHFEAALAEDSAFHASEIWLAFLGANGAGCGLTDSVVALMQPRRTELPAFDRLTLDISAARCRNQWEEAFQLAKRQAGLRPRSTYAVYTAGFFGLTSGHFREALGLLRQIDPGRDLGWLSDTARPIYWRDVTSSAHFLGEYEEERQDAERLVREFPARLAPRLFAARALAALGRSEEALEHLRTAMDLAADHAARMPVSSSPGGVAYLTAAELRVHGDSLAARTAAQMAVAWYQADDTRFAGPYDRLQLGRALALLGRDDEALAALAIGAMAAPGDPHYLMARGWVAARKGLRGSSQEVDAQLAAIRDPAFQPLVGTAPARLAAAANEHERAIELLEGRGRSGCARTAVGWDLHSDPFYDPLRGDERFERISRGA